MDHRREYPTAAPAVDVEMGHPPVMYLPLPTTHGRAMYPPLWTTNGQAMNQQQLGAPGPNNWVGDDAKLVVATLITTLTYQLGTNIPGGYWQETKFSADGKKVLYLAGDPIMRDLHRPRYWVFMAGSWVGFVGSMLMTLSLLVRMPGDSRHVRWSFAAYSSLVLTFTVSQPRTHLSEDIIVWVAIVAFLWLMISVRPEYRARISRFFCCVGEN